jgi:anti-sigma regulatory factor (Ser/Thr protein kinase)
VTVTWAVPVVDSTRLAEVRRVVLRAATLGGLAAARRASAELVATELATNLLKHAGGGRLLVEPLPGDRPGGVQLLAVDQGPGIADVPAALRDGYTTSSSLGTGLGACQRTADVFDLYSRAGRGTVALAQLHREPEPDDGYRAGGVHLALGDDESGDAWTCRWDGGRLTVMMADGLGHGPAAARASTAAVRWLHEHPVRPPEVLLRELHDELRATRGAAVGVAQYDPWSGQLVFAGIGNIGARLYHPPAGGPGGYGRGDGRVVEHLLSRPGIVGAGAYARPKTSSRPWPAAGLLALHSDGLSSRWQLPDDPALSERHPAVTAAVILRDAAGEAQPRRDDTTVAILTTPSAGGASGPGGAGGDGGRGGRS